MTSTPRTALVGYTGFVGGNLLAQRKFTDLYNSSNAHTMAGQHYDEVIFSAAKAEKWRINKDPGADLTHIHQLQETLASFTTAQLVLISTIDVYKSPVDVDENTVIDTDGLHAYGLHRHLLETFAAENHPGALIMRLPGLFGPGIKKNVIFDLLNNNNLAAINPAGSFQYYNLTHLAADITTALAHNLSLVNLATAPITTQQLAESAFGVSLPTLDAPAGRYDMSTVHAARFGGTGGYIANSDEVLRDLTAFVGSERAAAWAGDTA